MRLTRTCQVASSFCLGVVVTALSSYLGLFHDGVPLDLKAAFLSVQNKQMRMTLEAPDLEIWKDKNLTQTGHGHTVSTTSHVLPMERFAYGFYAVHEQHLIAALVNVNRLRKLSATKADFVILTNVKTNLNISSDVRLTPYTRLRSPMGYYADCFTKLIFFNMTQYERVIFLDVDVLVLKPLDALFRLPDVPIASPIAYWLDPPMFTAAFLVIKPNVTLFDVLVKKTDDIMKINLFDMDLLNFFYRHKDNKYEHFIFPELILLPGYFLTLSPHLGKEIMNWTDEERPKKLSTPFLDVDKLNDLTYVVHFSGGPKPWNLMESKIWNGSTEMTYYHKYNLDFKKEYNAISKNRFKRPPKQP